MDNEAKKQIAALEQQLKDTFVLLQREFSEQLGYGEFGSLNAETQHGIQEEVEQAIEQWQEAEVEETMTQQGMPEAEPIQTLLKQYREVEERLLDLFDGDLPE